ncbi:MAG TPA: hypothetical protein DD670_08650, partial [Planctomycetaceae bacterium]|nr:hypothetical protein [Planctomycetaceae bacterium]
MLMLRLFSFSWVRCVAVALAALSLQFAAGKMWAQTASKPAQGRAAAASFATHPSVEFVLQVYDVGDLVFNVPDYPYSSGGGGMSGVMGPMGGMGGGM